MAESNMVVDDMKHCYENLILIDAGANLTNKKYSRDLDAVIQRAQDSGKQWKKLYCSPFGINLLWNAQHLWERSRKINVYIFKVHIFQLVKNRRSQ